MRLCGPIFLLALAAIAAVASCDSPILVNCAAGQCGGGGSGMATSSTAGAGGAIVIPRAPECATPPMPGPGDIPCNVFDVIHRRCNVCHQGPPQLNGAPFPLLNYQDVDTCYGTMYRRWAVMLDAINPSPMLATPMPFGGPPLDAADLKTMNDWLTGGAVPDASGTGCGCKEGWPMVTGGNGCN